MRPLFNFALALVGGLLVVQLTVSTLRDRAARRPAVVMAALTPANQMLVPQMLAPTSATPLPEKSS
jgi:hypothetical protein